MNKLSILKKFLITDNEKNIEAIERYTKTLDERSYIIVVCEVMKKHFPEQTEEPKGSFNEIPDLVMNNSNTGKEYLLSYNNIKELFESLNLEKNNDWDIYRENYFISLIRKLDITFNIEDRDKFKKLIAGYNLYIKNCLEYVDINLLSYFSFPNFKTHDKKTEANKKFYISLQKYALENSISIIETNQMNKYLNFGHFRVDEIIINSLQNGDVSYIEFVSNKIISDERLNIEYKEELIRSLLIFYSEYRFLISKKDENFFINSDNEILRKSFFDVFGNNMFTTHFPVQSKSKGFTLENFRKNKMKKISTVSFS